MCIVFHPPAIVFSDMIPKSYITRKQISSYLYEQLTGNFTGFLVGMSATGLVSKFFATRSIRNFWGLASKKAVVSKETFMALEWIISAIIGFIVFEIMTKVVKEKIDERFPSLKRSFFRWLIRHDIAARWKLLLQVFKTRAVTMLAFNAGIRRSIRK